jgi:dipeptidyl aminopeptidase/acylaminoacyl peptidase
MTATYLRDRFAFAFSPRGRWAACLRLAGDRRTLEHWALGTEPPVPRTVHVVDATVDTSAAPLDDGRIVVVQREQAVPPRYRVHLVSPTGDGHARQEIGTIPSSLACHVLAAPGTSRLAVVVGVDAERSTVWEVAGEPPRLTAVAELPGAVDGGAWAAADVLALNRTDDAVGTHGVVVELRDGSWRQVWNVSEGSADRILLASPASGLLVVSTDAGGVQRLGWGRLGERSVRFPEALRPAATPCRVLALDDRGERLLVDAPAGASSRLCVVDLARDVAEPVPGPPCTVSPPASWVGDTVRFGYSAPDCPPALGTVRLGPDPRWSSAGEGDRRWAGAGLVELAGAAGPVEAIVYGGPDWRLREHLVLALHGGPLAAWQCAYDPLFAELVDAGAAVVAPNYRGSTGYGEDHLRAVLGHWGGPDLADVLRIGRDLLAARGPGRPRPVLVAASYGAYLGLLAACEEPGLWSGCAALAPFLSPAALHASGSAAVRDRVERLGGLEGPAPDVLRACDALTVPLLLVHGADDTTIPPDGSRTLHQRLLALGRRDGVDVDFLQPAADHTAVGLWQEEGLRRRLRDFCLQPRPAPPTAVAATAGRPPRPPAHPLPAVEGGARR